MNRVLDRPADHVIALTLLEGDHPLPPARSSRTHPEGPLIRYVFRPRTWSLIACLVLVGVAPAQPDDLARRLVQAVRPHPRIILDSVGARVVKDRLARRPLTTRAFAHVKACADAALVAPAIKRKTVGRRLLGVSRTCLKHVVHLAFTHRLSGEERYLRRAEQEMLAAAFDDWNPSHFLEVAEMTTASAPVVRPLATW